MFEIEHTPDEEFRKTLGTLATSIKKFFSTERETSISLGFGEAIDIRPQYPYGLLVRLINYERIAGGPDITFCFALRRTGQVDNVDDSMRYIPLENLDVVERYDRQIVAQRTASAILDLC